MRTTPLLIASLIVLMPHPASAFDLEQSLREIYGQDQADALHDLRVTQRNGKSLSEAIAQVRRQTGGRVISAETKRNGNRETHHIKVLTKDGKVRTHKVPGRSSR